MFDRLFGNIPAALLVCQEGADVVLYTNSVASALLELHEEQNQSANSLERYTGIPSDDIQRLRKMLAHESEIRHFESTLCGADRQRRPVRISADKFQLDGVSYVRLYLEPIQEDEKRDVQFLLRALRAACCSRSAEESIKQVLELAGEHFQMTELALLEILPEKAELCKRYQWSREKDGEEAIAPARDSAMSALIVPITGNQSFTGYLTVDGSASRSGWRPDEVQLLANVSELLSTLLERLRQEENVQGEDSLLKIFSKSSHNLIFISDVHTGEVLFCNSGQAEALELCTEDVEGKSIYPLLKKIGRIPEVEPVCTMVSDTGEVVRRYQTWEFQNQKNKKWYLVRSGVDSWSDGREIYIETAIEITRRKEHELALEQVASTDMMTGTYNRVSGAKLVENALQHAKRNGSTSLVFLDLDGLKRVNDYFGHEAGDSFLTETIRLVKQSVRRSDAIIRWGGDEFLILLRAERQEAERVMQKIQRQLKEYNNSSEQLFDLSFSYGVVELRSDKSESVDALISRADQAMYLDKMRKRRRNAE